VELVARSRKGMLVGAWIPALLVTATLFPVTCYPGMDTAVFLLCPWC
jgi:hypothetical protein